MNGDAGREALGFFLAAQRASVTGPPDELLTAPVPPPSGRSPLGLVEHRELIDGATGLGPR